MQCYLCGGEAEQVPFSEVLHKSKEIVNKNSSDEEKEEDKNIIIGAVAILNNGPYGQFRCKSCKKSLSTMELIGRSLCKVEPLPPGVLPVYLDDIRIETYTNSGSEIDMRLVHTPTGQSVHGKGESSFKLKKELMKELEKKLCPHSSVE